MSNNDQSAILMALGELKGQIGSIQSFLVGHSERMDRQDERMDKLEEKMDTQNESISDLKQTIAKWGGIGAVVVFLLPYVIKLVFPGA